MDTSRIVTANRFTSTEVMLREELLCWGNKIDPARGLEDEIPLEISDFQGLP